MCMYNMRMHSTCTCTACCPCMPMQEEVAHVLPKGVAETLDERVGRQAAGEALLCVLLLVGLDADAIEHLELAQLIDGVRSVVLALAERVAEQIEDDELRQLLELLHLLEHDDAVVADVKLHQRRDAREWRERAQLILLERELRRRWEQVGEGERN